MSSVPGCSRPASAAGGMHGSKLARWRELSCVRSSLVFGRRAGLHAAQHADKARPAVAESDVQQAVTGAAVRRLPPRAGRTPFVVHQELQKTMHELVGIIRKCRRDAEFRARSRTSRSAPAPCPGRGAPPVQPRLAHSRWTQEHAVGLAVRREGGL
ncbi:hypothetical protein HBB16_03380 [Pseudonocardia sp. MCCB 268]|nr:hypothetical protein [Pseudonocardia cytotoxica]